MQTKPAEDLATLARTLQFESSDGAREARAMAAVLIREAAQVMFEQGITIDQVVARMRGE